MLDIRWMRENREALAEAMRKLNDTEAPWEQALALEPDNARLERQSDTHQARSVCSSAIPISRQPDPASRAIDSGRSGKPSKPK